MTDIDTCCLGLEANKVTERRKCAENLRELLENQDVIKLLNKNSRHRSWDTVYSAVHRFIRKEGEKLYQDEMKQKGSIAASLPKIKAISHPLLTLVVTKANLGQLRLSADKLIQSILQCFECHYQRKYFGDVYLTVLIKHVLSVRKYWGKIENEKWQEVFLFLKELYKKPIVSEKVNIIQGLYLTIKYGSLHSSLSYELRNEFDFIKNIFKNINTNSSFNFQNICLKMLIAFCLETSLDCRMACCKLGEDLINSIMQLYSPRYENIGGKKSLIFEFLLLQVRLHHPGGVSEGSDAAYAFDWTKWKNSLNYLYSILLNEVDVIIREYKCSVNSNSLPKLWPCFLALIVEVINQDATQASILTQLSDCSSTSKRSRLEIGISLIISNIQKQINWPWLSILNELLIIYPNYLQSDDYVTLLDTLANLQSECKDSITRHYLYNLLSTIVQAQEYFDVEEFYLDRVEALWTKVWETSLRSVGLNQNEDTSHKLLQKMLQYKKSPNPSNLLSIYTSGVVNISSYSLKTLYILCQTITLPEHKPNNSEFTIRNYLIRLILGLIGDKTFTSAIYIETITADILVGLVVKMWPFPILIDKNLSIKRQYKSLEDSYIIASFENGLLYDQTHSQKEEHIHLIHSDAFFELSNSLRRFCFSLQECDICTLEETLNLIHKLIFLLNLVSTMLELKILNEDNFNQIVNLNSVLNKFDKTVSTIRNMINLSLLKKIKYLFSLKLHPLVTVLLRQEMSVKLLQLFFDLTSEDVVDDADDMVNELTNSSFDLTLSDNSYLLDEAILTENEKINLMSSKILCKYACTPEITTFIKNQKFVLETLSNLNFNPNSNLEFQTIVYLLKSINSCKLGTLPDKTLTFLLHALKNLFTERYEEFDAATLLLQILNDAICHIFNSEDAIFHRNSLVLLTTLYDNKTGYGPLLSVELADCLGNILKSETGRNCEHTKDVISRLLNLLKSSFQEVRLRAVKNILNIFILNETSFKESLKRQNENMAELNKTVLESFIITNNVSEEQAIDEAANRTSSSLHMFSALIVAKPIWRKKALYYLIQFIADKKIHIGLVQKVLDIICKCLDIQKDTFLNKNMNYMLTNWQKSGVAFSKFPFSLFGCESETQFCSRYLNVSVPILLQQTDTNILTKICLAENKSVTDVIKCSYSNLMAQYLPIIIKGSSDDDVSNEDIYSATKLFDQLKQFLNSESETTLLTDNLNSIVIELLNKLCDIDHFQEQFNFIHILPELDPPNLSKILFIKTLSYIEKKIPTSLSLIEYLLKQCPQKLENILLNITKNFQDAKTMDEKLISLYQYSVLVDWLILSLPSQNEMNIFIIRSIIYNLVNAIKINKDNFEDVSIAACRYLKKVCAKIMNNCPIIFEKFLLLIVSTFVPIAKLETKLSGECVSILHFLIVDKSICLYNAIGSLDPFPKNEKFNDIQNVYEKIKYGNDVYNLEQEVTHFLNVGNAMESYDRTEGLQHLRQQLSKKKTDLSNLYSNLQNNRVNYHDCTNTLLHQLIIMLLQLTSSSNLQVRLEAARCLGEIGPSNLITFVLKPEVTYIDKNLTPLELITKEVLDLLSQYLVNHESKVAETTSKALYAILSSKEGYQMVFNKECKTLDQRFVVPFIPSKKTMISTNIQIKEDLFFGTLSDSSLWSPTAQFSHSEWIISLVSRLLNCFPDTCFLQSLIPVCQVKMEFAEQMLPFIILLILSQNKKKCTNLISKQIRQFFTNHWQESVNKSSLSQSSVSSLIVYNKASVQCMLNLVHFVRLYRNFCENKKAVDEIELNYLHVAQGAQFCSAYFTSILYAELWCYNKLDETNINNQHISSTLELISENQSTEVTQAFENILRIAYKKIGDIDAMYGVGTSYVLNPKTRIDYYKNISRWDKVILHYDTQLSFDPQYSSDLVIALKNNSLHYLASNLKSEDVNSSLECAWRLNQWNLNIDNHGDDYEKFHYLALKYQFESDLCAMNQSINQARISVIDDLMHASFESSKSLYPALTNLQMLQEIENFSEAKIKSKLKELFETWTDVNNLVRNDFEYLEPIRAQRITLLNDIFLKENVDLVKPYLIEMHLQLANEARIEEFYHVAYRSLNNLSMINQLTPEMKSRILFEQAQLSWLDDKTVARYLLKYLLDNNSNLSLQTYATALKLYGNWMMETRSENPLSIMENYFEKCLRIFHEMDKEEIDIENKCEALESYARFADSQYEQVSDYVKSASFVNKIKTIKKFREMAKNLRLPTGDKTSDEKKAILLYERQSQIDETEITNAFKEKETYLLLAVKNYLKILELSDSYNFQIFRILSLSLKNKTNKDLLNILKLNFPKISSYKYIPLLPQLVPHIDIQNDFFEKLIQSLLERCAVEHPHHTLPIILALAESYKDRTFDASSSSESVETRVQTAKELIIQLKKKKSLTKIISNMELLYSALISLAYVDATSCSKGKNYYNIPRSEPLKCIKNMENVLLPTISLQVSKSCNYTNIVGIREFSSTFSLVGGINAPKKITCVGTDGVERIQLVKGKDDLRQDAVMQQVFNIMNSLLSKSKHTSKLRIRTYKVVPLSQRSGILEWCQNTEPLGNYLNEAHKLYHPTDMSPNEARAQLRAVHAKDHDIKYKKYKEVCLKIRPVFHHFFISSYPQPTQWFERRRAYMLSVATSSMVGYILGLGDRHVHNILLDLNTAEVIHIDFGIAFEQGRILPTPETVPFRLTRDIEDGMGVCGIEGVFRRSCEKTMQVLRQNSETVLTILEVLLYDPLYVWTITPAEAYSRQRDDDAQSTYHFSDDDPTPVNVTAERALVRLKQKLQGTENGGVCSIEGQVELLLQQARDPVNLSRLFNGWQAYL